MNILFINSSDSWGGTEKWVLMAASELQKLGHSIHFVGRSQLMLNRAQQSDIAATFIPLRNEADMTSLSKIRFLIKQQKTDVVISTKVREYWLGGLAAKSCGVKCVIRLGILRKLHERFKHRMIYGKLADGIIVNTGAIADGLIESSFINREKIRVIYNGVPAPENMPQNLPPADPFTILFAGSLTARKNVRLLIEIFHKFCVTHSQANCRLHIAGDGPQRRELEQFTAELDLKERVEFLGHRNDIPELLRQAHLFAFLSANEGFPNAAFEAMAHGVPVMLADMPGYREIVTHGKTAWLVDAGNTEQMLDGLARLFSEQTMREKLRERAFRLIQEKHRPASMARQVEAFLNEVIRGEIHR